MEPLCGAKKTLRPYNLCVLAFHFPRISQGTIRLFIINLLNRYNLKEAHLVRELLMEHIDREKYAEDDKELKLKLSKYKGDLTKGKAII